MLNKFFKNLFSIKYGYLLIGFIFLISGIILHLFGEAVPFSGIITLTLSMSFPVFCLMHTIANGLEPQKKEGI